MADGPAGFTQGSSCPALLRIRAGASGVPRTGLSPPTARLSSLFRYASRAVCPSYNPARAWTRAVWATPRSLATTWGITFVFSSWGYLDVSVPPVRPNLKVGGGLVPAGLPHSGIRGSKAICASPRLFAAYRALPRLRKPRYPPSALLYFLLMPCLAARRSLLYSSSFQNVNDLVRTLPSAPWRIRGSNP